MKSLYLVDAHCLIHRCYHSPQTNLTAPDGTPTKATFGYVRKLNEIWHGADHTVTHIGVCFDSNKKKLKKRLIAPEYKMGRPDNSDDLKIQIKQCFSITEAMDLSVFRINGYEADDLIATLAKQHKDRVDHVVIVTSDKDLLQLVDDKVEVYDPFTKYTSSAKDVVRKWGVLPDKVLEVMTLCGDMTDNVRGCGGVGPTTAAKLINKYGTANRVLASANLLTPKLKEAVKKANLGTIRELMRLLDDAPIEFKLGWLKAPESLYNPNVRAIFRELGFRKV